MYAFRKVASVLASTAMLSSTIALAAAANYPAPFVQGGNSNVAVMYGTIAAPTDLVAVTDISVNLQSHLARQTATGTTTTTTASVTGEATPVFSSATKFYINDSLNAVKSVFTKTELPTILADGSFSGNVDATYTQTIASGFNPQLIFAKQPTTANDPEYGVSLSTTAANYIYNATVTFNKAVNFTHADSKGQDVMLFGQKYTVSAATTDAELVLLKSAEKVSLTSDEPTADVTIGGKTYTIELVSASDTSATVKVTNAEGVSDTKDINENNSKKINGITVAVTNADETNFKLSATVTAGAEKITFPVGAATSQVNIGESNKNIDGTAVNISGGSTAATKITLSVYAPDSDKDAIVSGGSFIDPIYGSFKLNFAGQNIPKDSTTAREDIKVKTEGDNKISVTFTNHKGIEKTITFAKNMSSLIELQRDDDGHNITVLENKNLSRGDYVVVGNQDEGHLLRLSQTTNSTSGTGEYSSDKVTFVDVFSDDTIESTLTADGVGTVNVGGKVYGVTYSGISTSSGDIKVRLDYPDSTGNNAAIVYPTIKTSKGALLAFYEPIVNLSLDNWEDGDADNGLTTLRFPDGDGYTDITFTRSPGGTNFSLDGGTNNITMQATTGGARTTAIGKLTYNITWTGNNRTTIYLTTPDASSQGASNNIDDPGLILFEEKDDNSDYQAIVVTLDPGTTSSNGLDVSDVIRTWQADGTWDAIGLATDSDITKESDLWGTIAAVDSNTAGKKFATISYAGEQVFNEIYFAANAAEILAGTTTSGGSATGVKDLGSVTVADSEAASVATKNLIVVGGSCVNTVAAQLLGSATPLCGADFTTQTTVTAGQFLIETYSRSGGTVATLVAGYHAADTTNAAKYLTTQTVDTMVGKKYVGTTATTATLISSGTTTTGTTNTTT